MESTAGIRYGVKWIKTVMEKTIAHSMVVTSWSWYRRLLENGLIANVNIHLTVRLIHSGELQQACRQRPPPAPRAHQVRAGRAQRRATHRLPATFLNSSNLASHRRQHLPPKYHCQMCQEF